MSTRLTRMRYGLITRHGRNLRSGFSLLELLVTLSIIGILAGLLLPAIQSAREAARRITCSNHLRQIGLALQGYHSVHQHFPAGRMGSLPRVFSPQAQILPFLEQENLRNLIDFLSAPVTVTVDGGATYDGAKNHAAATTTVAAFLCPSDVAGGRVPGSIYGPTNYAANTGSGTLAVGSLKGADGVFYFNSAVAIRHIRDGTSHTAAFSERQLGMGLGSSQTCPAQFIWELPIGVEPGPLACNSSESGIENPYRGAKWILGNYGNTLYNHYYSPNGAQCDCMDNSQQKAFMTARSAHPGGVEVLYCDAGVRFVSDNIGLSIWRALSTRAGREVANE